MDMHYFEQYAKQLIRNLLANEAHAIMQGMPGSKANGDSKNEVSGDAFTSYVKKDVDNVAKFVDILGKEIETQSEGIKLKFYELKDELVTKQNNEVNEMKRALRNLFKTAKLLTEGIEVMTQENRSLKLKLAEKASGSSTLSENGKADAIKKMIAEKAMPDQVLAPQTLVDGNKSEASQLKDEIHGELKQLIDRVNDIKMNFDTSKTALRKRMEVVEAGQGGKIDASFCPYRANWYQLESLIKVLTDETGVFKEAAEKVQSDLDRVHSQHEKKIAWEILREIVSCEIENSRFDEFVSKNSCSIIRSLYQVFPKGMCYYKTNLADGNPAVFKILILPTLKKNYIKRLPNGLFTASKLKKPFDMLTAKEKITDPKLKNTFKDEMFFGETEIKVSEFYNIAPFGKIHDMFYIVPDIFDEYHAIIGFEFFYKYEKDLKISRNFLQMRDASFELFECPSDVNYEINSALVR